jgi:hypothetical protein
MMQRGAAEVLRAQGDLTTTRRPSRAVHTLPKSHIQPGPAEATRRSTWRLVPAAGAHRQARRRLEPLGIPGRMSHRRQDRPDTGAILDAALIVRANVRSRTHRARRRARSSPARWSRLTTSRGRGIMPTRSSDPTSAAALSIDRWLR